MMDNYSRSRGDGAARDLAFLLCLYLAVAGGFAFGLYELLQPTRYTNSGLTAYKPSAATIVIPGRASNQAKAQSADLSERIVVSTPLTTELDTDGRSMPKPPMTETLLPAHRPTKATKNTKSVKVFNRQITREPAADKQRVACLPRYDSSGAQTQAC